MEKKFYFNYLDIAMDLFKITVNGNEYDKDMLNKNYLQIKFYLAHLNSHQKDKFCKAVLGLKKKYIESLKFNKINIEDKKQKIKIYDEVLSIIGINETQKNNDGGLCL